MNDQDHLSLDELRPIEDGPHGHATPEGSLNHTKQRGIQSNFCHASEASLNQAVAAFEQGVAFDDLPSGPTAIAHVQVVRVIERLLPSLTDQHW